jgi:hypothetical protein
MWKRILLAACVSLCAFVWWSNRSIGRAAGILAPEVPRQENIAGVRQIERGDYTITPIASFDVEARVLGVKRYRFDREAQLSPYDLALGWGRMSDSEVLEQFDIKQSGRFYFWSTRTCPLPRDEVVRSSANMHIIPADDAVLSRLQRLREGHIVELKGYLVTAKADDGWLWLSSTTRRDSGAGACELVLVEDIAYR